MSSRAHLSVAWTYLAPRSHGWGTQGELARASAVPPVGLGGARPCSRASPHVIVADFFFRLMNDLYVYLSIYLATEWTNGFLLTSYLVAAAILQCLWSLLLAFVDMYALLVKRSLRNARAVCIFTIGDGVSNFILFYSAKYPSFLKI